MTSPIEALFGTGLLPKTDFPPDSRYHGIEVRTLSDAEGATVAYLARRFVPAADRFATLSAHAVREGERLDQIAARVAGAAERYWTLCDANGAIWPDDLEVAGTRLRLTLPADVPGPGEDR